MTQGVVDVGLAVAGATGSLVSGLAVARYGFTSMALACGLAALLVLPVVGRPPHRAPRAAAPTGPGG